MEIKDSYELPLPKEKVWAALNDEEFLKKSIPWCEKLERRSETELAAEVKLKIGPMSGCYGGRRRRSIQTSRNGVCTFK